MSKIEWTDKTWNPVTGCTKVSQGCKNCYAERMYERFHGHGSFKNVICHQDRLTIPMKWKKPSMVFVNSMSDLFHEDVPFLFINAVFSVMADISHHIYQVLTKRPERMIEFFQWKKEQFGITWQPSPNVWIGVSVEDQKTADERIPLLLKVQAAIRFLSCEPLLEEIDFYKTSAVMPSDIHHPWRNGPILQGIHWIICGGESGTYARPMHPDWARSLKVQCEIGGVPYFFKQWGEYWPGEFGRLYDAKTVDFTDGVQMVKVGKKKAGRLLDGQLYDSFPEIKQINFSS